MVTERGCLHVIAMLLGVLGVISWLAFWLSYLEITTAAVLVVPVHVVCQKRSGSYSQMCGVRS